ncbi:MAG: 3-oxoacid CoA-transferase subunit B [Bacilli bacterium]
MRNPKLIKDRIACKASKFLKKGQIVNLGIGIPTLVANYISDNFVYIHSENGMLGVGPAPQPGQEDQGLINAGKKPVTEVEGVSYFDSAESFAMIRGGHIHVTILGALEISERGDIANWAVPGTSVMGIGGAMDLVVGAQQVIVTTTHLTKDGSSKIVPYCNFPLTAEREVDILITEFAVFHFDLGRMILEEISSDITLEQLKEITTANYEISENLKIWPESELGGAL